MEKGKQEQEVLLADFNPHVVHYRDAKTRRVVSKKPFKVVSHQGVRFYEYPVGSGNLWWENRKPAGRLGDDGVPVRGAKHVAWEAPITQDETIAAQNATLKQENLRIQKELEAIKREMELNETHPVEAAPAKVEAKKPDTKKKPQHVAKS